MELLAHILGPLAEVSELLTKDDMPTARAPIQYKDDILPV